MTLGFEIALIRPGDCRSCTGSAFSLNGEPQAKPDNDACGSPLNDYNDSPLVPFRS